MYFDATSDKYLADIIKSLPKYVFGSTRECVLNFPNGGLATAPVNEFYNATNTDSIVDIDNSIEVPTELEYSMQGDLFVSLIDSFVIVPPGDFQVSLAKEPNEVITEKIVKLLYFIFTGDLNNGYSIISSLSTETKNVLSENKHATNHTRYEHDLTIKPMEL